MPKISILILLLELMIYSAGWSPLSFSSYSIITQGPAYITNLNIKFDLLNILTNLLILSSLLSLLIGSIVGLTQVRIKRLLAYSTISHIGFLLLALSVFSKASVEAFIFYIIQYTITNLDIFLIILAFGYIFKIKLSYVKNGLTKKSRFFDRIIPQYVEKINLLDIEYISNLKGFFYKNPLLSISFSICLFSFAGVPPLIGFFAKQQVLYASNSAGFYFLSLIAILVSIISASYYLKIIKVIHTYPITPVLPYISVINVQQPTNNYSDVLNNNIKNTLLNTSYKKNNKFEKESYLYLTSIHSFIISVLTLSIILFILNPDLILQSISVITSLIYNL